MNSFYYENTTVFAFHGCHKTTKNNLLTGKTKFNISTKSYDWLGSGVYFWENDEIRAFDWAKSRFGNDAAVIGARIRLTNCFDISNSYARGVLVRMHKHLTRMSVETGLPLPVNKPHPLLLGNPDDNILRYLDRTVVEFTLQELRAKGKKIDHSADRAAFQEGFELYPGSAFREHDHIHLCVRNPDLLTELFDPESYN